MKRMKEGMKLCFMFFTLLMFFRIRFFYGP